MMLNPFWYSSSPAPPPGGSPVFVAASAVANSAAVSVPSGVADGDFLLTYVTCTSPGAMSTPAGWSIIGSALTWSPLGYASALYYRVAASEPTSYTFGSGTRIGFMVAYRNASAIDVAGSYEEKTGTSMTFTGITSSSDSMLLAFIHDRDNAAALTQPSGMTLNVEAGGTFWRCGQAELLNATNANRTWTVPSSSFAAVGILVSIA